MIVKHRQFQTKLYGKTDAFSFFIVRMQYQDSNIPTINFYPTAGFEILRLARKISSKEKFHNLFTTLLRKMHGQGC